MASRKQLGITDAEYRAYKKVRADRLKIERQIDLRNTRNVGYYFHSLPRTQAEKTNIGKKLKITDFKSKYEFEKFLEGGLKYTDYEKYKEKMAYNYRYNLEQALKDIGASEEQIDRYNDIVDNLDDLSKLDEIFANNEELDIGYIYYQVSTEGVERIDTTLDVLEKLVEREIE